MNNLICVPRLTQCLFCRHRISYHNLTQFPFYSFQQVRGKKSSKHSRVLYVKLLKDVPRYGRQGSVIAVAPGRMRNSFYPRQQAAYVPKSNLREYQNQGLVVERDPLFEVERLEDRKVTDEILEEGAAGLSSVQIELLSPQRVAEILSNALPPQLVFYRAPITVLESDETKPLPPELGKSTEEPAEDQATPSLERLGPKLAKIFGSVSTTDIVDFIKAVLVDVEDGARVVLGAEDIKIIQEQAEGDDTEPDRIKFLGDYEVDIQVKGGVSIRRSVSIREQGN